MDLDAALKIGDEIHGGPRETPRYLPRRAVSDTLARTFALARRVGLIGKGSKIRQTTGKSGILDHEEGCATVVQSELEMHTLDPSEISHQLTDKGYQCIEFTSDDSGIISPRAYIGNNRGAPQARLFSPNNPASPFAQ
ncbi:hypothetical protein PM082_006580 [Marasmius tenuissimus]|nr:hypothetical protein PM082_006580 [Marasmius tenuissimus]